MTVENKFMPKAVLHFETPVDLSHKDWFKRAVKAIAEDLNTYNTCVQKNPNALIPDIGLYITPEDVNKVILPADIKIAELVAMKADTSLPDMRMKDKPVSQPVRINEEPEEAEESTAYQKAKRKAIEAEEAAQGLPPLPSASKSVITAKKAVTVDAGDPVNEAIEKIFVELKRTEKSLCIITALAKAGKEMNWEEIMSATNLNKNDLSSWFSQTGKKVKAIVKTGRGTYKFDPELV